MHVEMDLWRGVHLESRGRMRQERDAGVVRERDVGERRGSGAGKGCGRETREREEGE